MIIKIALVGSTDFCRRTEQLVANRKDIQLDSYHYKDPKEAARLIETLKPCDAILFSGSLPYFSALKKIEHLPIPTLYLKQDETAVAITLLHLAIQTQLHMSRLSIDVREKSSIEAVINELDKPIIAPFIHVLEDHHIIDTSTEFHKNLFLQGKTDQAITSIHAVYEQLNVLNIPVMKMIDPESSILTMIEHTKQQAILQKSNSAQIAIGIVKISMNNLEPSVEKIAEIIQARWNKQQDEYTLFTTKGNIESALNNHAFLTLFDKVSAEMQMAFGYGESIVDATENAKTALEFVEEDEAPIFYIVDAYKKLQGPFPVSNAVVEMRVNDPILVEMVEKTKLSPANISKLLAFSQSRQAKQFTANDLALYLNVTRRTAERTLKKLVQFEYVQIVGEEMTYRQGRPRALYEFNVPIY